MKLLLMAFLPFNLLGDVEPAEELETPIVEEVQEEEEDKVFLTPEEIEQIRSEILDEGLAFALSTWDKILAMASVGGLGGAMTLFLIANRKFKWFDNSNKNVEKQLLGTMSVIRELHGAVDKLTKEEQALKTGILTLISALNIDPYTKDKMLNMVNSEKVDLAELGQIAELLAKTEEKTAEETQSLLDELTEDV